MTGSSTIAPLAAELAMAFEVINPELRINVQTGGSSRGLADIRQNTADIGMVSRKLTPSETDVRAHLLAKDGVSIIVHADNPIKALSSKQIRSIYLGKIKNWQALTGKNEKITVINKAEGRSTLEVFLHYFDIKNTQIKSDIIIGDNEQAIKLVSRNPSAIAYVSIATAEYNVKAGTAVKTLPLDGVDANLKSLAAGDFPLNRELNFVTSESPTNTATAFIAFAQSPKARSIIEEFGFVPNDQR